MSRIIAFLPDYNEKHANVLRAFAEGCGAETRPLSPYVECDIAVIFGLFKKAFKPTWPKLNILKRHRGRRLIVIESAFVKRGEYYQVGWGGQAGHADFRNNNMPNNRWRAFNIKSRPWQRRPDGPVVVCGQVPRDTTVQDVDHTAWCHDTFYYYNKRGENVVFRPHPRVKDATVYGVPSGFRDSRKLKVVLGEARCFVTWNSTSGVDAAIAGVPVIALDRGSYAWPIASHSLDLDKLRYPSRKEWLAGLGYAQWTLEEMRSGLAWSHLSRGLDLGLLPQERSVSLS